MTTKKTTPAYTASAKGSFAIADLHPVIVKKTAPVSFEGAIFDLDGTLVDSITYWENLAPAYLASRRKSPTPEVLCRFRELTIEESASYMKEVYELPESAEEICRDIIAGIRTPYRALVALKPGVAGMLDALEEAGVRMCVASASEKDLAIPLLERLGVAHHFCGIYTCSEVGASKSQPDVFEWALRELGTPRKATVVFEDSLHAIKTAKQAGFGVVAVRESSAAHDAAAIAEIADVLVDSFEGVLRRSNPAL